MRPEHSSAGVRIAAGVLALLQGLALCGCGQKGPLYLPDHTTTVVTHPAATPPQAAPQPDAAERPAPPRKPGESDDSSPPAPPH